MDELIYLDNAASTMKKPESVVQAITEALTSFGGPGRGGHPAAIASSMALFKARAAICELLNAPSPERVALTANITESLNIAAEGLIKPGDHVITTAASHNSVLRPLYRKESQGAKLTIVAIDEQGQLNMDDYEASFMPDTKWVVITHSSNLTGDIYDIKKQTEIAHAHGAKVIIDAAQTAGVVDIDMDDGGYDIVCVTGHKSLYGPQGIGAIAVAEGIEIPSYKVGGSGVHSYDKVHPDYMPESLEAGTANAHGAAGFAAGVSYVLEKTPAAIRKHTNECIKRFEEGVKDVPGIKFYGGKGNPLGRCGISAINLGDADSSEVSDILACDYNICTRPGAHCAPLMHEALGTVNQGIVRFGFCSFTTFDEVDAAIKAIHEIAESVAE